MADITLENTIPDAWQAPVTEAFLALGGKRIEIRVELHGAHPEPDYRAEWTINNFTEKGAGENLVAYGERVLRELGKAIVFAHDKQKDRVEKNALHAAIGSPVNDLPDDILT